MAAVRRPGYDQACRLLASGRLHEDIAEIGVPAAVINGEKDSITPVANGLLVYADLQKFSPRVLFHVIEGAGHAVCQEQPEEVAHMIAQFVADNVVAHA